MNTTIRLREVPEQILDRSCWEELLEFAHTKQNALELINAGDPQAWPEWWDLAVRGTSLD